MNIEVERIPSHSIAYRRQIGPYGVGNVQLMENFKCWVKENDLLNEESIILGIAQDNPAFVKSEECRYDACLIISEDACVKDDSIGLGNIVGGKYAVFRISHTVEAVQKAWMDIFPELLKQGYSLDETRPILERYKAVLVSKHYCEICVPIQ